MRKLLACILIFALINSSIQTACTASDVATACSATEFCDSGSDTCAACSGGSDILL
jgi:hypothetical protein